MGVFSNTGQHFQRLLKMFSGITLTGDPMSTNMCSFRPSHGRSFSIGCTISLFSERRGRGASAPCSLRRYLNPLARTLPFFYSATRLAHPGQVFLLGTFMKCGVVVPELVCCVVGVGLPAQLARIDYASTFSSKSPISVPTSNGMNTTTSVYGISFPRCSGVLASCLA